MTDNLRNHNSQHGCSIVDLLGKLTEEFAQLAADLDCLKKKQTQSEESFLGVLERIEQIEQHFSLIALKDLEQRWDACVDPDTGDVICFEDFYQR